MERDVAEKEFVLGTPLDLDETWADALRVEARAVGEPFDELRFLRLEDRP